MLSTRASSDSKPIAINKKGKIVYLDPDIKKDKNEVEIDDLTILPRADGEREVLYICASSGTGKSYLGKQYIQYYLKMYKKEKRPVYIFSPIQDDKTFKDLKSKHVYQIPINTELLEEPIDPNEFENCLICMDDIDSIHNKEIRKALNAILVSVLESGRHKKVSVIMTSHLILSNDKPRLRTILNESHLICFSPRSTTYHNIFYFLKNYLGIQDKNLVNRICNLPTRFVTMHKNFPNYLIYDEGVICV